MFTHKKSNSPKVQKLKIQKSMEIQWKTHKHPEIHGNTMENATKSRNPQNQKLWSQSQKSNTKKFVKKAKSFEKPT